MNRISAWAKGLPESAWTPGIPPQSTEYCAVKTESGAILAGRLATWLPNSLPVGKTREKIIAYILVGEQSHPDLWENSRADPT